MIPLTFQIKTGYFRQITHRRLNKEKRGIIPARFQKFRILTPAEVIQNNRNTFSVI